ncbi:PRC-barrel domain-containing protein [Bacillus xiapuensis]|uniref:PRC-barrel domain-containing protein n=1 Tax=Bacillus xiapuensis TaxID=2014075 RepID=UPI000C23D5E5|nr:PRC-barrel domain-containing protein [Bacillus xiapuensis]
MKKSAEIKGLPIFSIADGAELGRVKSLIINPDQGRVDFFTVEHEEWQAEGRAIPFQKVIGIGDYALTIENEGAIIDLNEIPIAKELLNRQVQIENTRVMTRKGQLLGEAEEYVVDEDTGSIITLDVTVNEQLTALDSELVITYGKDVIIAKEEAASALQQGRQAEKAAEEDSLAAIEKQQDALLIGKTATKDIVDLNGALLIPKGTVLTEEHIQSAREAGPEVLVDVSMSAEG